MQNWHSDERIWTHKYHNFFLDKCGNFDRNPTASIKSYWEPGYPDTPLFSCLLNCAYLVSYRYKINFLVWVTGLTKIKAKSASRQSWSWDLAELGKNKKKLTQFFFRLPYILSPIGSIVMLYCEAWR